MGPSEDNGAKAFGRRVHDRAYSKTMCAKSNINPCATNYSTSLYIFQLFLPLPKRRTFEDLGDSFPGRDYLSEVLDGTHRLWELRTRLEDTHQLFGNLSRQMKTYSERVENEVKVGVLSEAKYWHFPQSRYHTNAFVAFADRTLRRLELV